MSVAQNDVAMRGTKGLKIMTSVSMGVTNRSPINGNILHNYQISTLISVHLSVKESTIYQNAF